MTIIWLIFLIVYGSFNGFNDIRFLEWALLVPFIIMDVVIRLTIAQHEFSGIIKDSIGVIKNIIVKHDDRITRMEDNTNGRHDR